MKKIILILLLVLVLTGCDNVKIYDSVPQEYMKISEEIVRQIEEEDFNFVTNATEFQIFWTEENDALGLRIISGKSYNRERSDSYIQQKIQDNIIDEILVSLCEQLENTNHQIPNRFYIRIDYKTHRKETVGNTREQVDHWEHVAHTVFYTNNLLEEENIQFTFLDL